MNGDAERRSSDRSRTPSPLSRSSSRSSIGQSPGRTTLLKRNQSLSAKQIRFYRNGDRHFAGLKLAVSSERYKEFFPLLVELSDKLDLPTGAVRFVFDAESGRQITDVSQLNSNSCYVCSSTNNFKEIEGGYGQTQSKNWSMGPTRGRNELTNWSKPSPRTENRREFIKPKLVTVVKNGKPPQKKVTMLLNKKTALDLNQVLDHLSSKGTLGKVDRLCCLDGREIKELRDLFNEDMIFIAFASNERFPEEGFDVDVQSYRITPYRDLKRASGVKRSSSLRTPRPRRNTLESNASGAGVRGRSVSPSPRTNGQSHSIPRAKLNGSKKINNGGSYTSGEELYPAAVFQRENSDSAKKVKKTRASRTAGKKTASKKRRKQSSSDKFYSTVWLSDYESWDMKSETGDPSTCQSSRATTPFSSRPTTPFDSRRSSPLSSPPSSPFVARESLNAKDEFDSGHHSDTDRPHDFIHKPKAVKLTRTLSLPESELSQIEANDLQQRFTTLQLEQENKELKQLTDELQGALENLEKRVHSAKESDESAEEKPREPRARAYSSDDGFGNERSLNERAASEPSSPSSISSNDTFVHSPKLSKPNSLDLSGGARKRKHAVKPQTVNGKSRKTSKDTHDNICCITS